MFIKVRVVRFSDDEIVKEQSLLLTRSGAREWLDKTIVWAMHNGCGVQLWNANDKEPVYV